MLGQVKQRSFFSFKNYRATFIQEPKRKKNEGHYKCFKQNPLERSGVILAAFSHRALFLRGTGHALRVTLWFGAFLRCSIFLLLIFLSPHTHVFIIFFFFYSAVLRDSFSSRKEHTQCEREKVNLSSKTSSGNINHVINEKKMHKF